MRMVRICDTDRVIATAVPWAKRKLNGVPGDRETLSLFTSHRGALVSYAQRILGNAAYAEDVVQEAYLRFSTANRVILDDPLSYLYRVVRNLALDGRRRFAREGKVVIPGSDALLSDVESGMSSPEAQAISQADVRTMVAAMAELPERTRIALEMHRFGGCTFREIAEHLGISLGLAHSLVIDGLEHCRTRLQR